MRKIVLNFRDGHRRPVRRTIVDGLAALEHKLEARPETRRCHLHVPRQTGKDAHFVFIWFRPTEGDELLIAYPASKGCWASTSLGARIYLSLDELDGALLDEEGNVLLDDGRSLHALELDVVPHPEDFTDLEQAIVFLTVRYLNAEATCLRCEPEVGYPWVDYAKLGQLSVRNVKELALYIDAEINYSRSETGLLPLDPIPLAKIRSTLARAGIRKVRGRRPKLAA